MVGSSFYRKDLQEKKPNATKRINCEIELRGIVEQRGKRPQTDRFRWLHTHWQKLLEVAEGPRRVED